MPGINQFFAKTLGAKRTNSRWSWGGVGPATDRVFLQIWEHQIGKDRKSVEVARSKPPGNSHGERERHRHLDQIRDGAEAFGVVCVRTTTDFNELGRIRSFDQSTLRRLGKLITRNGATFAQITRRVPVAEIARKHKRTGKRARK